MKTPLSGTGKPQVIEFKILTSIGERANHLWKTRLVAWASSSVPQAKAEELKTSIARIHRIMLCVNIKFTIKN
jgi:hypothetical protein